MTRSSLDQDIDAVQMWHEVESGERERVCASLVKGFSAASVGHEDVAKLAQALANSGDKYSWPTELAPFGDVPSTGGPSSLTTLLCPYLLAANGVRVPKLGVPGSTAGALDVLALLRGVRLRLSLNEAVASLSASGVVHLIASDQLAPADRYLFEYRKRNDAKAVPALVAASLLSKKITAGCPNTSLDVREGPSGNVGRTDDCERFSRLFCDAAAWLGLRASCTISSIDPPATPFFGRSESLGALIAVIKGTPTAPWTDRHVDICIGLTAEVLAMSQQWSEDVAQAAAREALITGGAWHSFVANLSAQGSGEEAVDLFIEESKGFPCQHIESSFGGPVAYRSRDIAAILARTNVGASANSDLIGATCLVTPGQTVSPGQPLLCVRNRPELSPLALQCAIEKLRAVFVPATEECEPTSMAVYRNWM